MPAALNGILIVDKPAGWTSHDVVGKTRGLAHTRRVISGEILFHEVMEPSDPAFRPDAEIARAFPESPDDTASRDSGGKFNFHAECKFA